MFAFAPVVTVVGLGHVVRRHGLRDVVLRRAGHACHLVHDGAAAIASVKRRPPDVVITDYKLGGEVNGMEVLRETKKTSPETEVILITGISYFLATLARDSKSSGVNMPTGVLGTIAYVCLSRCKIAPFGWSSILYLLT